MLTAETYIRVRYGEVDRMGYVYYGNYPLYYESARTEMLRKFGLSYLQMEDDGIILPVMDMHIEYLAPALYDDLLTIKTKLIKYPAVRLIFNYEIYNETRELLNKASTTLVFADATTKKPRKAPYYFLNRVKEFF
ncbi:MAG TPA: thioesterase family protein [Bacteroidales bacterium]|nr:thioesterase family protein [Bacteroidales bacterium]